MLLMMIPAAAAENAVLDLRGHTHVSVQFAADASVLTVVYPQMTFADACILVCDGHAAMIDAGGYAQEEAVMSALSTGSSARIRIMTMSRALRRLSASIRSGSI